MSATAAAKGPGEGEDKKGKKVTITVNNKPVVLHDNKVTGLQIKQAAIAQDVEIELDFLLFLEHHGHHDPEQIADDRTVEVNDNSIFTCNDGEDDS